MMGRVPQEWHMTWMESLCSRSILSISIFSWLGSK